MQQEFTQVRNDLDAEGRPAGGVVVAPGLTIVWQNGPLGRGEDRKEPNGAFVETVIVAAAQRIEHYNEAGFGCDENYEALVHLRSALLALSARTARREMQGVEGTHQGS